ncbi:NAD binding domain of 6-phosphogluconate dehydrogenase-domain-containing protein [Exophiala viscosa]|uniref:NAD binding domain of 6-phosphogluconate dehydrogenase-domain-containing protein n=1 Tax=Exophiala viscosa TaxID=2486360 RepID=UPI0021A07E6D|nr:NAD binding domain of 6-phosphogluconate dehydrogenase-domain-containing protein [Exophiala viscosa]
MTSQSHTFGFIGLGNMGSQMSHNLATYAEKEGYPKIQVWNRTRAKIEYMLKQSYCEIADTIEDLAQKCDIIHTCLANDEVALSVFRQILAVGKQNLILVDHSTLYPTTSSTLQAEAEEKSSSFMSCPVFGPPAMAKSAGLLVALSGKNSAKEIVKQYIVPTIGKGVIDCGEDSSRGALLKILGNSCILGTIELLSESFTLAEKTGFDPALFYEFIQAWFPAAAWVNYGKKIKDGTFSGKTGFTLPGGMKDASFIRRLGAETSTPTPIIDQAWNHLTTAKAIGGESLDWSACAAGMRVTAGLPPFKGEDFSLASKHTNGVNGAANGSGKDH